MNVNVDDWERGITALAVEFSFVRLLSTIEKNPEALKMRLFIAGDFFVQIYVNLFTGTRNLVLVLGGRRVYGRDCQEGRNWHRHTVAGPQGHDFSPDGTRAVTVREFLVEVQEILEQENIL